MIIVPYGKYITNIQSLLKFQLCITKNGLVINEKNKKGGRDVKIP